MILPVPSPIPPYVEIVDERQSTRKPPTAYEPTRTAGLLEAQHLTSAEKVELSRRLLADALDDGDFMAETEAARAMSLDYAYEILGEVVAQK